VSRSFDLPEAESITVGTVGEPGRRTFYLQLRNMEVTVTLKLEKQQVAGLSQLLSEVLSDLPALLAPPAEAPPLTEPLLEEWAVGAVQLAYEASADRIVILAQEVVIEEGTGAGEPAPDELASGDSEPATARFSITREQASALVRRGFELVEAGRPPCPLCGHPIDPEGHSCPRTNGHRSPTP
jgi:uncharacterized repeat protein (TIGR03847 family)